MRFDPRTIAALNAIAWWDWDIEKIIANEDAIVGNDIERLLAAAD